MTWPPSPRALLGGDTVELTPTAPAGDAESLFEALDDARAWEHLPGRPSSPAGYEAALRRKADRGWFLWTVRLRRRIGSNPSGGVVGVCTYLDVAPADARLEIASQFSPTVWGTAVNPEAKLVLLTHAFEVLGAGRVQFKTDARNVRSQHAIARTGAVHEATLRRHQRRDDGTVRDNVVFSIVAEDWPSVRSDLARRVASRSRPG